MSDVRRRAMFSRGAEAFARSFAQILEREGISEPCYVCPLCLTGFSVGATAGPDPMLTVEHAPPKSLGGHAVCLTCKPCNNGTAELNRARKVRDRFMGAMNRNPDLPIKARIQAGDIEIGASLVLGPDHIVILSEPDHSHPEDYRLLREHVRDSGSKPEFTLHFSGYNPRLDRIGRLRDGYLAAFALLGYRYIMSDALSPVRQQIRAPSDEVVPVSRMTSPELEDDQRFLILTSQPVDAIVVVEGTDMCWLPGVGRPGEELWDWIRDSDQHDSQTINGTPYEWPRRMTLLLDNRLPE